MKKIFISMITEFELQLPYYFCGVGCEYPQEHVFRPSGYPTYQWIQCRKGRGEVILEGKKFLVEEGQGMFLFPNEPHEYYSLENEWIVDWVLFNGRDVESFLRKNLKLRGSCVSYITTPKVVSEKLDELYLASTSDSATKSLTCSSLTYETLLELLRLTSPTQSSSIANQFNKLTSVLNYIEHNYNNRVSLAELSHIADLTPQYLCSLFKKVTSMTPFEYINMLKIRKSKELLIKYPDMQIKEISFRVGFEDVSYFGQTFRKFEKMTPSEFRVLYK